MEEETTRHLRGIRILVTIALLAACISFAFTYILFREVSIPLEHIRTQQLSNLESKVNFLVSSRLDGRLDVELQLAILNMKELLENSSGDIKAQAQKALAETQTLLDVIRKARTPEKAQ